MLLWPVVLREVATRDVADAVGYFEGEGGASLALQFIDALESAMRHISLHARSGSARYAIELDLPELRSWPLKRFPYLIFHAERDSEVDVWRVLHGPRDIPAWLLSSDR